MVSTFEFSRARLGARYWISYMSHFLALLELLEGNAIPRREPLARSRRFFAIAPRVALRYALRRGDSGGTPGASAPSAVPRSSVDVVGP